MSLDVVGQIKTVGRSYRYTVESQSPDRHCNWL